MAGKSDPIAEILVAWETRKENDPGEESLRAKAKAYVTSHPDDFADLSGKSVDELVAMVDRCRSGAETFRETGLESEATTLDTQKLKIDIFLLGLVPKRYVGANPEDGGGLNAIVRLPELGGGN